MFGTLKNAIKSAEFPEIGGDAVQGFTLGIEENAESAVAAAKMAAGVTGGTKNELASKSPSKVFEEIGTDVVQGFADGITSSAFVAIEAATEMLALFKEGWRESVHDEAFIGYLPDAVNLIAFQLLENTAIQDATATLLDDAMQLGLGRAAEFPEIGAQMMSGIQRGIEQGASGVVSAMKNAVTDAINAAKSAADIHSPSRIMQQQIGGNMMQGWIKGVNENVPALGAAFHNAAEVSLR